MIHDVVYVDKIYCCGYTHTNTHMQSCVSVKTPELCCKIFLHKLLSASHTKAERTIHTPTHTHTVRLCPRVSVQALLSFQPYVSNLFTLLNVCRQSIFNNANRYATRRNEAAGWISVCVCVCV